jgi:hypothetical protein
VVNLGIPSFHGKTKVNSCGPTFTLCTLILALCMETFPTEKHVLNYLNIYYSHYVELKFTSSEKRRQKSIVECRR